MSGENEGLFPIECVHKKLALLMRESSLINYKMHCSVLCNEKLCIGKEKEVTCFT